MAKPRVFISHISEEAAVARPLKVLIESQFIRVVEVFVSSHEESIRLGDDWFDAIRRSITDCGLMIVICSPVPVSRPWINFETGAGWAQGIPVVPLCHSGLTPGQLPLPLSALQGGLLGNKADIQHLFARLAILADTAIPTADFGEFFTRIRDFESENRKNILKRFTVH